MTLDPLYQRMYLEQGQSQGTRMVSSGCCSTWQCGIAIASSRAMWLKGKAAHVGNRWLAHVGCHLDMYLGSQWSLALQQLGQIAQRLETWR